jgi:drug/metabolite transporter (DMT)-like permease
LTLLFGIGLGVVFGVNEDSVKAYIADGIAEHPEVHDEKSQDKIWRYAQRAHFHATGIAAFSLGLVLLVVHSSLRSKRKKIAAILIGLGGLYPLSWFTMFLLAPSIGRGPAHEHLVTTLVTYVGTGCLLAGIGMVCANVFFGKLSDAG